VPQTVLKQAPEENSSNASTDDNVSPARPWTPQESWEGSCNGTQVFHKAQLSMPFEAPPGVTLVPQTVLKHAPEENSSNASTDETVLRQAPEENSSSASTDDNVSPAHPQESWEGSCNGRLFSISQCLGSSSSSTGSNRSSAADSLRPQQQPEPKQVANTVVDKTSEILMSQGYAKSWIEVNMLLNRLQQKGIF